MAAVSDAVSSELESSANRPVRLDRFHSLVSEEGLGRELRARLEQSFPDVTVQALQVAVEENSGQRGIYRYRADAATS